MTISRAPVLPTGLQTEPTKLPRSLVIAAQIIAASKTSEEDQRELAAAQHDEELQARLAAKYFSETADFMFAVHATKQIAGHLEVGRHEVIEAISTLSIDPNVLLDEPSGWQVLASYVALYLDQPCPHFEVTVH